MADKIYIELDKAKSTIMDYIAEQTVSKFPTAELCKASRMGAEGAMYELDYIPTVDVEEVVRCKDCEYAHFNSSSETYHCKRRGYYSEEVKANDFCSYGERKDT